MELNKLNGLIYQQAYPSYWWKECFYQILKQSISDFDYYNTYTKVSNYYSKNVMATRLGARSMSGSHCDGHQNNHINHENSLIKCVALVNN